MEKISSVVTRKTWTVSETKDTISTGFQEIFGRGWYLPGQPGLTLLGGGLTVVTPQTVADCRRGTPVPSWITVRDPGPIATVLWPGGIEPAAPRNLPTYATEPGLKHG